MARKYAENDVVYLRQLHEHLDSPEPGDTDSELAAMVACVRWRGFEIKLDDIKIIREEEKRKLESVPTAPNAVKVWLLEVMSKTESIVLHNGTGEEILNSILTEWTENPKLIERVQAVLDARHAMKEIELYDKLIKARKFHASFKVIGSLSTRMSGSDDLNPQGIKGTYKVRNLFPLKREGFLLCGGDFDAFEVSIAESVYNDQNLRHDILSGKSPHGLFACELYPEKTYEEIEATKKTDNDLYGNGKTAFFRLMYGGNWQGMVDILNVEPEVAERAFNSFLKKYSGIGDHRDSINSSFCSMTQPAGIGTQVVWKDPCDYIDNGLGFKRYFSLENQMCKMLFDLANEPPKHWKYIKAKVLRKDRQQTACGAAQSALYAAAFNIQARNLRAAANHQIQSKGAQITKEVQRSIWDIQPIGVHDWVVQPMNIHDEIMCPTRPDSASKVKMAVEVVVQKYREIVPLLSITWKEDMESWARK
ncbi:MAG: DNA polymerase [Clostridia bacterium]